MMSVYILVSLIYQVKYISFMSSWPNLFLQMGHARFLTAKVLSRHSLQNMWAQRERMTFLWFLWQTEQLIFC